MTPKEKAKELISKFTFVCEPENYIQQNPKQCALICIDEIIDDLDCFVFDCESDRNYQFLNLIYLREVKQELEKL